MTDYRNLSPQYFEEVLNRVLAVLPAYGVGVQFSRELPENASASFSGDRILMSARASQEVALFTLIHVFGHIVQVSTGEYDYPNEANGPTPEIDLLQLRQREQKASEYTLGLLHRLGIGQLDQWISDLWHRDWEYVEMVYAKEAIVSPTLELDYSHIPYGRPRLQPRPVPHFKTKSFPTQTVF